MLTFFGCSFLLILGLIKPDFSLWWSQKKTRKMAILFYGAGAFTGLMSGVVLKGETSWIDYTLISALYLTWIAQISRLKNKPQEDLAKSNTAGNKQEDTKKTKKSWKPKKELPQTMGADPKATWEKWASNIHDEEDQLTRQKRAWGCYVKKVDRNQGIAQMSGSGTFYTTTLEACTCPDFAKRDLPCKHMYRLAMEMGLIELSQFLDGDSDYTLS